MTDELDATTPPCEGGYVLIHRKMFKNPNFKSEFEAMAFAWLVTKASWRDVTVRYKDRAITLHRGQLAVSLRDMAEKLDRTRQWAERFMTKLAKVGMIETSIETGVSVVTICNYDIYQRPWDSAGTPSESGPGQGRDTTGTQNNKGNKENKGKEEKDTARGTRLHTDWVLPDGWRDFAKTERGWSDFDVSAEANEFRDYWIGQSGSKGVKADWQATWRNWVRRSYRKATAGGDSQIKYPTPDGYKTRREWLAYRITMLQLMIEDADGERLERMRTEVRALIKERDGGN